MRIFKTLLLLSAMLMLPLKAQDATLVSTRGVTLITMPGAIVDISPNGKVAVGYDNATQKSFYWTEADGQVYYNGLECEFRGVSNDTTIVGDFRDPNTLFNGLPVMVAGYFKNGQWTSIGGLPGIQPISENDFSKAYSISADGSTIVGMCWTSVSTTEAYYWTQATGVVGLGSQGGHSSRVNRVSDDGSVMVGWDEDPNTNARRPFMWNPAAHFLGSLDPTWTGGEAFGVSGDGQTIVGTSAGTAFIWTPQDSMQALIPIGTFMNAQAFDVADNGLVVGMVDPGFFQYEAFIQKPGKSPVLLKSYLVDSLHITGIDNFNFHSATAVSASGNIVVGWGTDMTNPNPMARIGFVLKLGEDLDPQPPRNFAAYSDNTMPTSIQLTWTDPSEYNNGTPLTNFTIEIVRDSTHIASVPMGTESYLDDGLITGQEYTYTIWAKDNVDSTSSTVSAKWMAGGYVPVMTVNESEITDTLLIGESSQHTFKIKNTPAGQVELQYSITPEPSGAWLNVTPISGTIPMNAAETITVEFQTAGISAGTYTSNLIISGNDPNNSSDTIAVTLVVNEAPLLVVTPDSLYFELNAGAQTNTIMTIQNSGAGILNYSLADEEIILSRKVQPQMPVKIGSKGIEDPVVGRILWNAGGPDAAGYKWVDSNEPNGPAYQFTDISGTGNNVTSLLQPTGSYPAVDEGMAKIQLPFPVKFYGQMYDAISINSNGVILFDTTYFNNMTTNQSIPNTNAPNGYVAAFWDDLTGGNDGAIYTARRGNRFIIQYSHWHHYGNHGDLNFQIVLNRESSTILFAYGSMADHQDDATIGIENMDGTIGLAVSNDEAYVQDNLTVQISQGADWLSASENGGTLLPGESKDIQLSINTNNLLGGNYLARMIVSSNDPQNRVVYQPTISLKVVGQAAITTYPDTLDFGNVILGVSSTLPVVIENPGTDSLIITDITSTNPMFYPDTTMLNVPAQGQKILNVAFTPTMTGLYDAYVVFQSNDPNHGLDSVYVVGNAIPAPAIQVENLVQQNLQYGDSIDYALTITNNGGSDLIYSAAIDYSGFRTPTATGLRPAILNKERADLATPENSAPAALGNGTAYPLLSQREENVIYDNGQLVNGFGTGFGGADESILQTSLGMYLYGTNAKKASGYRVADDIIIGDAGWQMDTLVFYAYQTGSDTISTITEVNLRIWDGIPGQPGAQVVFGDDSTNLMVATNWSGIYRVTENTSGTAINRPIMVCKAVVNTFLPPGEYWLDWQMAGTSSSGPWVPPVTITGQTETGNAITYNPYNGNWEALVDVGPQGLPFQIIGKVHQEWMSLLEPSSGVVPAGGSQDLLVRLRAMSNDTTYTGKIKILSNDPSLPEVVVTITLDVLTGMVNTDILPTTIRVEQNYPNPFNPSTVICYQLPQSADVTLDVYNLLGQKVRTLVNGKVEAGYHTVIWDGRNDLGEKLASGLYIYRFDSGSYVQTRKMLLLK